MPDTAWGRDPLGGGPRQLGQSVSNYDVNGAPVGATVADGDYGDIVVAGPAWSFDPAVVTAFIRPFLATGSAADARSAIGAQASDAQLAAIAGLAPTADQVIYWTGATTAAMTSFTAFGRSLAGSANLAAALATLALTTAAKTAAANVFTVQQTINSGVGAPALVLDTAGLAQIVFKSIGAVSGYVVSDATNLLRLLNLGGDPRFTLTQAGDLTLFGGITATGGTLTSPTLAGTPTAPTAAAADNSTKVATTAFVQGAITDLIAMAPGTLNTLDELAAAMGDDPNFATTVTTNLAGKLVKTANLSDLSNSATARTNLGLGTAAVEAAATLLARANHTGTQLAATISDFNTASDARVVAAVGASTVGTSFPGSPATGARCFRTDRLIEYVYNGTRWLSTGILTLSLQPSDFTLPITATKSFGFRTNNPWAGLYDIYVLDAVFARYITATSSWTYGITRSTNAATTTITSTLAAADALNVWVNSTRVAVNAVVSSAHNAFDGFATLNSGAASCFPLFSVTYRLVG